MEGALADHPRIGERPSGLGRRRRDVALASRPASTPTDADALDRLADGNRRYEERFGRIYLVRAAGRTAAEMLDLLEQRLTNDPATELGVTKGQLAEIATLRLKAPDRMSADHEYGEHPRPRRRARACPRPACT